MNKNIYQHKQFFRLTPLIFTLIAQPAASLESDQQATLEITAETAELNEQMGIAIYSGDVELKQGSLTITSDQLTIKKSDAGVETVTATGNPAKYRQLLDNEPLPAKAAAKSITYFVSQQKIRLSGDASLHQAGNRFEGEKIEYDIVNKILTANSDTPSTSKSESQKKRVKMLLPPATRSDGALDKEQKK